MSQIKPWQLGVIIGAVASVCFAIYWTMSGSNLPKMNHSAVLVDITTGELFEASTARRSAIIPEKNPNTGQYTLYPAKKGDDGLWRVPPRYLEGLDKAVKADALMNGKSGEVKVKNETPVSMNLGK